ncbi:MAG TPA: hypothetical protein VMU33_10335 [Burkholderiaceae bacterium]|nr:hypothetical protein [Burkholderiaceae bacterium]
MPGFRRLSRLKPVVNRGLALAASAWTSTALAASGVLAPGAVADACASALVVGTSGCARFAAGASGAGAERAATAAAPAGAALPRDDSEDARIDAALASHGKPSREAMRALLDPTDENILAMMRKEDETLAIAAYVGQRMTDLRTRRGEDESGGPVAADGGAAASHGVDPDVGADVGADVGPDVGPDVGADPARDMPSMIRMRATLVGMPTDPDLRAAATMLGRVADRFPALDARVVWITDGPPRAALAAAAAAAGGLRLPLRVVAAEATEAAPGGDDGVTGTRIPAYVVLHDLRFGLGRRLAARGLDGAALRDAIIALRESGRQRIAAPAGALGLR